MNILDKKWNKRFLFKWGLVLLCLMAVFLLPNISFAKDATAGRNWIPQVIAWVLNILIGIAGKLLTMFIDMVVSIFQYDNFIDERAVSIGWVLVRDITNMFFIILMLLIAVGTLFNIETYQYKKLLPKLVIAAVLVNFSKMIVGMLIDVGQVVMLTFVAQFKAIAAAGFIKAIGVQDMLTMREIFQHAGQNSLIDYWRITEALALAFVLLVVAMVVMLTFVIVLVGRILMLWILIIFSPIAIVVTLVPNNPLGKVGTFGKYWGELTKYVVVGPVLAFFMWLSFRILQEVNSGRQENIIALYRTLDDTTGPREEVLEYFASKISTAQNVFDYIVVIGLLVGSLMITQQMGVMGGNFGMNAVGKMKGWAQKGLTSAAKWTAMRPVAALNYADRALWSATGFSPYRTTRELYKGWKAHSEYKKQIAEDKGIVKAGDHLKEGGLRGLVLGAGAGRDYAEVVGAGGVLNYKGLRRAGLLLRGKKKRKKLDELIKNDRKEVAKLKRTKEEGKIEDNYVDEHEAVIEESQEEIKEKEKQTKELEYDYKDAKQAYEEEQNKNSNSGKLPRLKSIMEQKKADMDEQTPVLKEEIKKLEKDIKVSERALTDDSGKKGGKTVREKAIEQYERGIKKDKWEVDRLENGKLSRESRMELKAENDEIKAVLKKIDKDIKEKKSALGANSPVFKTLDKQANNKKNELIGRRTQILRELRKDKETDEDKREGNIKRVEKIKDEIEFKEDLLAKFKNGQIDSDKDIDDKITVLYQGLKDKQKDLVKYQAPQTFYADQSRRTLESEAAKKITSDNWQEQLAAMRDALMTKDWARFVANFKAAAERGNENEVMDQLGYVNAYRGHEDDKGPWMGGGMEAFRKHYLVGKLGMSDENSMGVMDDIGYIGEGVGHWSVARGYGIKAGKRYAKDYDEQQEEVYAEQSKLDGRKLFRNFNRLGWGGEVPQMDGSRMIHLEPYTIRRWLTSFKEIHKHIAGGEFSKSQAEHFVTPVAIRQLTAAVNLLPIRYRNDYMSVIRELREYARFNTDEMRAATKTGMRDVMSGLDFGFKIR